MSFEDRIKYRRDLWKAVKVPGDTAEIGVAEGYFSAEILSWNIQRRHYLVDRWKTADVPGDSSMPQDWHIKNFAGAQAKVSRFGRRAVFLRGESMLMAHRVPHASLSFLYIDGDHTYPGVMRDLDAWHDKVKAGGIIAFHDFENEDYGVKPAVMDFLAAHPYQLHHLPEDKVEDAGAWFYVGP